ncbi:MAG: DUF1275 domain-containing protein [Breznakibacter sp.]|nr:DUF1275 domain-containing protein [Breznakibacter sp.]
MLSHTGKKRTFKHNVMLAALLSLTAGFVNVIGFSTFMVFTTNITGHVALMSEKIAVGDYSGAIMFAIWLITFLCGAFISSLAVTIVGRTRRTAYTYPLLAEVILLALVMYATPRSNNLTTQDIELLAGTLLFAMGMQNAMVSLISGSVVRTTHLTGMFTDLGIELSTLITHKEHRKEVLKYKVNLRLVIIFFFIFGGLVGGFLYKDMGVSTFWFPITTLIFVIVYDGMRYNTVVIWRKIKSFK